MSTITIIACIIIICWVLWFVIAPLCTYIKYYQKKNYPYSVKKKDTIIFKKNTISCSDMTLLHDSEDIDDHVYDSAMPIQKVSNECFRCSQEVYSFENNVNYFAYDRELCGICWHKITRNINNHI